MAILLDGRKVAQEIRDRLKDEIDVLSRKVSKKPVLACICRCENPAIAVYLKAQAKVALDLGIDYRCIPLAETSSSADVIAQIRALNADQNVHGIIVQTPLPMSANIEDVVSAIAPQKDAEGVHPENLGRLLSGEDKVAPCTAQACMELLRHYRIGLRGKEVVIVGHSNIVGKPLSLMLLKEFATTTVCHIATSEAKTLESHVRRAEILIVAAGKPNLIPGGWIKEGAVVIDVGINKVADMIVGDVEFSVAQNKASYITPVPGGVGPMTVAMLMKNCVELFKQSLNVI